MITAGAGIALTGLLLPAAAASAATASPYSYATGFDSGSAAPTWLRENFYRGPEPEGQYRFHRG